MNRYQNNIVSLTQIFFVIKLRVHLAGGSFQFADPWHEPQSGYLTSSIFTVHAKEFLMNITFASTIAGHILFSATARFCSCSSVVPTYT